MASELNRIIASGQKEIAAARAAENERKESKGVWGRRAVTWAPVIGGGTAGTVAAVAVAIISAVLTTVTLGAGAFVVGCAIVLGAIVGQAIKEHIKNKLETPAPQPAVQMHLDKDFIRQRMPATMIRDGMCSTEVAVAFVDALAAHPNRGEAEEALDALNNLWRDNQANIGDDRFLPKTSLEKFILAFARYPAQAKELYEAIRGARHHDLSNITACEFYIKATLPGFGLVRVSDYLFSVSVPRAPAALVAAAPVAQVPVAVQNEEELGDELNAWIKDVQGRVTSLGGLRSEPPSPIAAAASSTSSGTSDSEDLLSGSMSLSPVSNIETPSSPVDAAPVVLSKPEKSYKEAFAEALASTVPKTVQQHRARLAALQEINNHR